MDFLDTVIGEAQYTVTYYVLFASSAFVVFYHIFKRPLSVRKIQSKFPPFSEYRREVLYSLLTILIFSVVSGVTFYVLEPYTNIYYGSWNSAGAAYYALSWLWLLLLHDTYFYWAHRLMHAKRLYARVHKIHHLSSNPSPWTAYAFHPAEALLEAGILPLAAFTLPLHYSVVAGFFIFQIAYNVYGHLGYELYPRRFHRTAIGKWVNTSVAHNQHHACFQGNYGLYFLFWDRMMGTLREDYDDAYEKATNSRHN